MHTVKSLKQSIECIGPILILGHFIIFVTVSHAAVVYCRSYVRTKLCGPYLQRYKAKQTDPFRHPSIETKKAGQAIATPAVDPTQHQAGRGDPPRTARRLAKKEYV